MKEGSESWSGSSRETRGVWSRATKLKIHFALVVSLVAVAMGLALELSGSDMCHFWAMVLLHRVFVPPSSLLPSCGLEYGYGGDPASIMHARLTLGVAETQAGRTWVHT